MSDSVERFREACRAISDLGQIQGLLDWDQQVLMPRGAAEQRGQQLATLALAIHERITSPALGAWIDELAARPELEEHLRADVREMKRARDRALRLPEALVAERARVCALAQQAWQDAFERDDFPAFRPHLEQVLRVMREVAAAIGTPDPYDALLDEHEPGVHAADLAPIFDELRVALRALLDRILGARRTPDADLPFRAFPVAAQETFARQVLTRMGFDFAAGRLDRSVHPFTSGTFRDVRITARYSEEDLATGLFSALHEGGHGLYEQGLDPQRYRDPAGGHCSLGVHESQSRLWENLVGRSRPFWRFHYPLLLAAFPGPLEGVELETFYRAINRVRPSLVRVEADEVTYNLHVILRFELERALLAGDLAAADLPAAWAEGMERLLGLRPPTDRQGALQDVHWSVGLVGYFPTYTLGNLLAAQLFEAARRDVPDLEARIAAGDLASLKRWLNAHVHGHGRRYLAPELCRRATGADLSPAPALRHLEQKYSELYAL